MKRIIEITSSFTGKISTAQFENASPFFSLKDTIELDVDEVETAEIDRFINTRQRELQAMCVAEFNRYADILYQEKVAKAYKNIRFYDIGDGLKVPSVTSIINMDANFFTSPNDLAQMAARGTIIHKQVELFLKDGKWREPKEIPEIAFEVMTVAKGTLGLSLEDVDFPAFYAKYPFRVLEQEKVLTNKEHKYAGRMDILCVIESSNKGAWDKVEGIQFDVPTILDVKTGASLDKAKGYTQQSAYAMCLPEVKQIGLIHLTKENQCGYAKPSITQKIDAYANIFLKQRQLFAERYGI